MLIMILMMMRVRLCVFVWAMAARTIMIKKLSMLATAVMQTLKANMQTNNTNGLWAMDDGGVDPSGSDDLNV